MSRKNKFFILIVFFAIITPSLSACGQKKGPPPKASGRAQISGGPALKEGEFIYDAEEKRNPFAPLVTSDGRILEPQISKKTADEIYVEGIIYDAGGSSYAVINGEIVKGGDMAGRYQVLRIEPQKVIFLKEGKEFEVELKRED